MKRKAGDVVMIYDKPLTEEKPEGKARLIHRRLDKQNEPELERWFVRFDDGDGRERLIKA